MNGHQVWKTDRRGGMNGRIQDYSIGISSVYDLCLQPQLGERNG
jgi:hypothetical protein